MTFTVTIGYKDGQIERFNGINRIATYKNEGIVQLAENEILNFNFILTRNLFLHSESCNVSVDNNNLRFIRIDKE